MASVAWASHSETDQNSPLSSVVLLSLPLLLLVVMLAVVGVVVVVLGLVIVICYRCNVYCYNYNTRQELWLLMMSAIGVDYDVVRR